MPPNSDVSHGARLQSAFEQDPEMTELLTLFREELPQRVQTIRAAMDRADTDRLRTLAHQMKGAAGGYGFAPISEAAASLEAELRAGEIVQTGAERIARLTQDLIDLCQSACVRE